jgi:hypothetical protein
MFVCCLLQMEEQCHCSDQQECQCTVTCWPCNLHVPGIILQSNWPQPVCSSRYCCDTASQTHTHHSEVCCEDTSCDSRSHHFRTCLCQAQLTACPAAAGRGDGCSRSNASRTHTHSHVLLQVRSCVRVSHRLRHSGKVQGPPMPETAATSPLGVVCSVPSLTDIMSSDARGAVAAYVRTQPLCFVDSTSW